MSKKQEEKIVLEIFQVIDIEDHIELKYNLSAIMSGLATGNCFQVEIADDSFASVFYEDGNFNISIVEGRSETTYVTDSYQDALMYINGEDDDFDDETSVVDVIDDTIYEMRSLIEYYYEFDSIDEFKYSAREQLEGIYDSLGGILGK